MPNLIMEYSVGLPKRHSVPDLLAQTHQAAVASQLFKLDSIKVRAIPFDSYLVGGEEKSFVHTTVTLLDGRSPEEKAALAKAVVEVQTHCWQGVSSVTVDVQDMDRRFFQKVCS